MQLHGAWGDALAEARLARERCDQAMNPVAAGQALYQQGELHRLQGEFGAAEARVPRSEPATAASRNPGSRCCGSRRGTSRRRGRGDPTCARRDRRSAAARGAAPGRRRDHARGRRRRRGARRMRRARRRSRRASESPMLRGDRRARTRERSSSPAATRRLRSPRCGARGSEWQELNAPYEVARVRVLVGTGVPRARRRGHGRAGARRGARRVRGAAARRRTSLASTRSTRRARRTG